MYGCSNDLSEHKSTYNDREAMKRCLDVFKVASGMIKVKAQKIITLHSKFGLILV